MSKRDWGRKTTQVVWEDLRPWVEQLREVHQVRVVVSVFLLATTYKMKPTISVELVAVSGEKAQQVVRREWMGFDATICGSAASAACHLVSRLLLELDDEKARAEQGALPFDA